MSNLFKIDDSPKAKLEQLLEQKRKLQAELESLELSLSIAQDEYQKTLPVSVIIRDVSDRFIFNTLSQYDKEIVNSFRHYPSFNYTPYNKYNRLNYDDWKSFLAIKPARVEIAFATAEVKQKYEEYQSSILYNITLGDKFVVVTPTVKGKTIQISFAVKSAHVKENKVFVPLADGWALYKYLISIPITDYNISSDAWEFIKAQYEERDRLQNIRNFERVEYDVYLNGYVLKDFQTVGAYFCELSKKNILADEVGLGKTIQAIAPSEKNNWRTLFVVPANLMLNWENHIQNYTGKVPYIIQHTEPTTGDVLELTLNKRHQYVLINYESMIRFVEIEDDLGIKREMNLWVKLLNASKFDRIVEDEAHYIKNTNSARSKAVMQLQSERETFLTGTPVLNRPAELFPMLHKIDPVSFPNKHNFMFNYSDGNNGAKNVEQLRELIAPLMLRRTKKDVLQELDPIVRIPHYFELNDHYRTLYKKALDGIFEMYEDNPRDIISILAEFTRLKQIASHAGIESTLKLAEEITDEGEGEEYNRIIIASQYKDVLYTMAEHTNSPIITGDIPMEERMEIVKEFNQHGKYLFYMLNRSMVTGLDITGAGHVIHHDLSWTPSDHVQLEGRAYGRIADAHSINSYFLLAKNSIYDGFIWPMLLEKIEMFNQVVDGIDSSEDLGKGFLMRMLSEGR